MAILTDSGIEKFLDKKFVIHPFDKNTCLTPLGYDLRIGYAVALGKGNEVIKYENNEEIVIPAKSSMFIISKEHIWLSGNIVGTLHSIGGLAAQGLLLNSTTIDPNWAGQLTCLITNPTKHSIKLDSNSRFITMILHQATSSTTNTPQAGPITVAKKYGNIYGEKFSQTLLEYFTSEENKHIQKVFNEKIDNALLQNNLYKYLRSKVLNLASALPNWLRFIFILVLILITFFCILLIPYWETITMQIGMQSKTLDGQTFIAIIAVVITSIMFIIGLFKAKQEIIKN